MVEITDKNAREASQAAERLLRDQFLTESLDEMVQIATEKAITAPTGRERREGRYLVLAIGQLRANLGATFEHWRSAAETLQRMRAHE